MSEPDNKRPSQKLLFVAMIASAFAIIGTASVLFYLGMFSQPSLEKVMAPSYRLVYVNHTGPYNEIKGIFKQVEAKLKAANITPIAAAALFFDDPAQVAADKLRSKVGYIISDRDYPPSGLIEENLLSQQVIRATFDGSPMIGSYKAYPAMKQWSSENHYQLSLPSLEIYYTDGRVEYQLPISRTTQ